MPNPSPHDVSLRRKRRKSTGAGTGASVPVPDPTLLVPLADPDHPDARRCLPGRRIGASVPEAGIASGVAELHPLDGVAPGVDELECAASSDLERAPTFALF